MEPTGSILHVCERAPYESGSYNHLVYRLIELLPEFDQYFVCGDEVGSEHKQRFPRLLGYRRPFPASMEWLVLRGPGALRRLAVNGIESVRGAQHYFAVRQALRTLKPALVICHDAVKIALNLRRMAPAGTRLVLSQRGFKYELPQRVLERLYSLAAIDTVCHLTGESYEATRRAVHKYEPRAVVLKNGLADTAFQPRDEAEARAAKARHGFSAADKVVLFLSRLAPKKGAHVVLQSFAEVRAAEPAAKLWIVGGGPEFYLDELQRLARNAGLQDCVRFHGAVPRQDVPGAFACADVFVFPTLCAEGAPGALIQALARGVPVVSSDFIGMDSEIRPCCDVVIQAPNDSREWARGVVQCLKTGGSNGSAGKAAIIQDYGQQAWLERTRRFFAEELALAGNGHISSTSTA
jgi:glycosyltransferase involved in cell wall biosynthesis